MTIPLLVYQRNLNNALLLKVLQSKRAGLESNALYIATTCIRQRRYCFLPYSNESKKET